MEIKIIEKLQEMQKEALRADKETFFNVEVNNYETHTYLCAVIGRQIGDKYVSRRFNFDPKSPEAEIALDFQMLEDAINFLLKGGRNEE